MSKQIDDLTVVELREVARKLGVKIDMEKNKEELISEINKAKQNGLVAVDKKDLIKTYIIDQAWYTIMNYEHGTLAAFRGSIADLKTLFEKLEKIGY